MGRKRRQRKVTTWEAYAAIICMLIILGIGGGVIGFNLKTMLVLVNVLFIALAFRCGVGWAEIEAGMAGQIASMSNLFMVLLGIGFLIASIIVSGTVQSLVVILVSIISPKYCVIIAFLFSMVMSMVTGSSFCTMSTIGVVLFNVAKMQGIPTVIAASAGNYSSPMSDIINCLVLDYDTTLDKMVKDIIKPYAIAAVISAVWFYFLGRSNMETVDGSLTQVHIFAEEIKANFYVSPVLLLPIVLIVILLVRKVSAIVALFGTGIVAMMMGIICQGYKAGDVFTAVFNGFSAELFLPGVQVSEELASMVNRGGMLAMSDTLIFMILSLSCIGIMGVLGIFEVIDKTIFKKVKTPEQLTISSMLLILLFGAATGNDFATVVISRDLLDGAYKKMGVDLRKAAAVALTGAIVTTMCLPWSFCADYSAAIFGVRVLEYVPYSIWFWILPVVVLFFQFLDIRRQKAVEKRISCKV